MPPPRTSASRHAYPSDYFGANGAGPAQSPSPSMEQMLRSRENGPRRWNDIFLGRLARLTRRRRQFSGDEAELDYRERWPTVTTLVEHQPESRLFPEEDADQDLPEPARVKALQALATPLEWLADRFVSMSDHLDHKIDLAKARAEKQASAPSSRRSSMRPGQSTHPYDTGVGEMTDHEDDGEGDVASIPKPRHAWKTVRGRRASGYPGKDRASIQQSSNGTNSSMLAREAYRQVAPTWRDKHDAAMTTSEPLRPNSQLRFRHPRKPVARSVSGQEAVAPASAMALQTRSRLSSANRGLGTGASSPHSGKSGTPAIRDFAMADEAPKAGAIRQWLNHFNVKPPSRAVSPRELSEDDEQRDELPPHIVPVSSRIGRRSNETTSSRGTRSARTQHSTEPIATPEGRPSRDSLLPPLRPVKGSSEGRRSRNRMKGGKDKRSRRNSKTD
ncbi:hypothetical protein JX265_000762 [Neoarthrinium moseri]|uniref:Uncharacterized protein n=1 Tax=Neoarthrinium moseri TaxID=1658444 RepID=A0A9Q0ARB6_9PEZI|nr:uncharacterized protein JN550_007131 [Neoarthrinium moseri]KAI1847512.1 hypothetical protein JX266_006364 [Neoarthrinium moseri]KAI1867400.1 hypothetical protein JN550_007131 [Neoarthrinium moseri]KAI1880522.1 hypothetical protein JX265_000762 [Neoarthrinium moseri]